jgi:hypothetical protein
MNTDLIKKYQIGDINHVSAVLYYKHTTVVKKAVVF